MTGNADLTMEFHWARKSSAYSSKQQKNRWRFHDTGQYAQLNNFSITKTRTTVKQVCTVVIVIARQTTTFNTSNLNTAIGTYWISDYI